MQRLAHPAWPDYPSPQQAVEYPMLTRGKKKNVRVLMIVENCAFLKDPRVRREAIALRSVGYHVSVICPREARRPWRETLDGIRVYRFPSFPARGSLLGYLFEYGIATVAIALLSLLVLLCEGFDVIHVANPPDTLVLTLGLYKLFGKRIIYDQHDLSPELYIAKFRQFNPRLVKVLRWLEGRSFALADHVIAANESYKQIALTRGRIPESKVTVVRNGPDLEGYRPADIDDGLRQRSRNIIVYSGIIGFQDGLDTLCRILHILRYELGREDFCCVIMGDGDALPKVKTLAKALRLEENIWFTGWIDDSEIYQRYLNTADVCVSPEPYNDYNNRSTFVKIMEYMAAGKPIVSFDLAETHFSARDASLYATAGNEREFALRLAQIMDNSVRRSKMGRSGQERIRRELAWRYSLPGLFKAYAQCRKHVEREAITERALEKEEEHSSIC
jgi:glycosyltransferase involved in cell wall biosynthesis